MFAVQSPVCYFHQISSGPGWSVLGCHRNIQSHGFMRFLKSKTWTCQTDKQLDWPGLENKPSWWVSWAISWLFVWFCLIEFHSSRSLPVIYSGWVWPRGENTFFTRYVVSLRSAIQRWHKQLSSMHCNEVSGIRQQTSGGVDTHYQHNILTFYH